MVYSILLEKFLKICEVITILFQIFALYLRTNVLIDYSDRISVYEK